MVRLGREVTELNEVGAWSGADGLHCDVEEEDRLHRCDRRDDLRKAAKGDEVEGRRADHGVGDRVVLGLVQGDDDLVELEEILLLDFVVQVSVVGAHDVVCGEGLHVLDVEQRFLGAELCARV